MEGPSLFLAAEQLAPFVGQTIRKVSGNTKIGKERLLDKEILEIFSWGKHLVFQFDTFALRVHFMLFGTFEASIQDKKVTGDYEKTQTPRLALVCDIGHINMYNCSLQYIESPTAHLTYDFTVDVMSAQWDPQAALKKVRTLAQSQIGDVLLDQTIFAGVGNIIKNEVLFLEKKLPETNINEIPSPELKKIINTIKKYSHQFYEWRKQFVLRKNFKIYRQSICPTCGNKVTRKKTGRTARWSFICFTCQH